MGDKETIKYTAPFIWDNIEIFDEIVRLSPEPLQTRQPSSTWYAHPIIIERMKKKKNYQQLAIKYETKRDLFSYSSICEYGVIQSPCKITNVGTVYNMKTSTYYTNGGCRCRDINTEHIPLDEGIYQATDHPVISVTELWGHGIWHFPFEVFVALCTMPKHILHTSIIHVNEKTQYVMWWISQLGINPSHVICGHIYSKRLTFIPRLGKCGNPYVNQIFRLQHTIKRHIPPSMPVKYVTIVKRTKARITKNFDELLAIVTQFAESIGLQVYIHDDSNLPDLLMQQGAFHQSQYVFAPHGAAGIHIPAMKPGAHYIEILDDGLYMNMCYARVAYWTSINYYALPMYNSVVELNNVKDIIKKLKK